HRPQDRVEAHRAPPLTWEGKGKPCALPVQVGTLIEDVLSVREELRFGRELQLPAFSMERAYIPSFWSLWVSGPVVLQRPLGGRHHMDGDLNYAVTSKGQMLHGVHRLVFADAENGALLRGRKTRADAFGEPSDPVSELFQAAVEA